MTSDGAEFPFDGCPTYDGPRRASGESLELDPDCCSRNDCPQRDYNRACILALENLSRAYASLHLLRSAASRLWTCDDEGHTADCPNPECRFGMDMVVGLDRQRKRFAASVVYLFEMLTVPAADISGQWQAFVDTEQARQLIEDLLTADQQGQVNEQAQYVLVRTIKRYIGIWQREAVGDDPIEHARWFQPPADSDAPPN